MHSSLNTSKGVNRCPELRGDCEEEILENLKPGEVTLFKRFNVKRNGILVPTNTLVFTFNSPTKPAYIKIGFIRCEVSAYVPNPTIANGMDSMSFGTIEALSMLIALKQQCILLTSVKIKQST